MAGTTTTSNADFYGDLAKAIALYFGSKKGTGSGDTPNFFEVPLTPEEKRKQDEIWRVYKEGGSDTMKTVQGLGKQWLSGLQSGPSNFQFMSPELKGQQPFGGYKLPTFDFSKLPMGQPTKPTTTTPPPAGNRPPPGGDDPLGPRPGIKDKTPVTEPIDIQPNDPFKRAWRNDPPGELGGDEFTDYVRQQLGDGVDVNKFMGSVTDWWSQYQAAHPNWKSDGAAALQAALTGAFGPLGTIAGGIVKWIIRKAAPPPTPPTSTQPVIPPGGTPGSLPQP